MRALFVLFVLAPVVALAADTREIDFTQVLHTLDGKPMVWTCSTPVKQGEACPEEAQVLATLSDVAVTALETTTDSDRSMDPMAKFKLDVIAHKIYKNAHAVLPVEDITTIKDRIGKVYGPAQIGAAWPLLDPSLK
jgi:hypothetical protein